MNAIEIDDVRVDFGGVHALDGVTLTVAAGEFVGLIGPNGAGKTTLFNVIAGAIRPSRGAVRILGAAVRRATPASVSRMGVARTFQLAELFGSMSARENVATAAMTRGRSMRAALRRADEVLERVALREHAARLPHELSVGNRRRLEIARALALEPRVLLADEVMAGVAPPEIPQVAALLAETVADGVTVLAVEHNLGFIVEHCPRVVVLASGRVIADGRPAEITRDPHVVEVYVGASNASLPIEPEVRR